MQVFKPMIPKIGQESSSYSILLDQNLFSDKRDIHDFFNFYVLIKS